MPTRSTRAVRGGLIAMTLLAGCATWREAPAPGIGGEVEIGRDVVVKRIADRAYVVTESRPWPANALLVEMPDSTLVLVNTLYRPEAAERLLSWTRVPGHGKAAGAELLSHTLQVLAGQS